MDQITLTGLRVFGRHGVFAHERENGQHFVIDLVLTVDTHEAARTDEVTDTVHYGEVADAVAEIVGGEPVALIEALAARIATAVLAFDGVSRVQVTVHKPQAPIAHEFADVAVTITRARAEV
ncbi:dihydroneopterin aldolase [Microbacterium fluvii]|uniref:7,8-dihydroneopterin aldolase n=1 Tax=Microbacterium fluvii TaxID=415215 RepID=A0ABW2HIS9_9MICO|nr:dihydroneopterin aldolase [Microbacterium fluvii]MCU4673968.1 dihydroneopterin aldolase [Microbacterium fluvii]